MKKLIGRLKSTRGESLIESMAAILIFTFASILFLALVNAAADVNLSVREADDAFQTQLQTVEISPSPSFLTTPNAEAVLYPTKEDGTPDESNPLPVVEMTLVTADGDDALYTYRVGVWP